MRNRSHHQAHKEAAKAGGIISLSPSWFRVLCWKSLFVVSLAACLSPALAAQTPTQTPQPPEQRTRYQINLTLDPDNRTYKGTERVRWINRGEHPTSTLFFHLYPNLRVPGYVPP